MNPIPPLCDASLLLDDRARVIHCSDALLALTGWRRDEVVGADWFERFLPTPHDAMRAAFARVLADDPGVRVHDNEILTRGGERRLLRWQNAVLRSSSGRSYGTVSVASEVDAPTGGPVPTGGAPCVVVPPHRSAEAIVALIDDLHVDPDRAGLSLIRLIAEQCAELAEECGDRRSARDAAEVIRTMFALVPDGAARH